MGRPSGLSRGCSISTAKSNVPTWYSSVQWFAVFIVLFGVAERRVSLADRRSWSLWLLPLVFLTFSADEVVQFHEHIGARSDVVVFGSKPGSTQRYR